MFFRVRKNSDFFRILETFDSSFHYLKNPVAPSSKPQEKKPKSIKRRWKNTPNWLMFLPAKRSNVETSRMKWEK
jgi:hypothetical protein